MNIVFICGSLEEGRNGVGDYTRRLSAELIRKGHNASIVSINDKGADGEGFQQEAGVTIEVLRMSERLSLETKRNRLRNFVRKQEPRWISLQFVPYSFNGKGIPVGLGSLLNSVGHGYRWHIMFHELWLGLNDGAGVKHYLVGSVQKFIIKKLLHSLCIEKVSTHTPSYRYALKDCLGIDSDILPLFGNIPYVQDINLSCPLPGSFMFSGGGKYLRSDCLIAGVFGEVHPEWDLCANVNTLIPFCRRLGKKLVIYFFGKSRLTREQCNQWEKRIPEDAHLEMGGFLEEAEVSLVMQEIDFALATTPWALSSKSGSIAAMLEHGLNGVLSRNDWKLRSEDLEIPQDIEGLFQLEALDEERFREVLKKRNPESSLARVADIFISKILSE